MNTPLTPLLVLILSTPLLNAASVLLDFNTEGQFTNNFRLVSPNPVTNGEAVQVLKDAEGYVKYDRTAAPANAIAYLYDTTPAEATPASDSMFPTSVPLTVSFDFYAGPQASTFAVIFSDANDLSRNVMALFRIDHNFGAPDQVAFYKNGAVTPDSLTPGKQVGANITEDSGIGNSQYAFTSGNGYSATLTVDGTTPTISLTVGNLSLSRSFAPGDADWANTVVSIRLYDRGAGAGAGVGIDNFQITSIPQSSATSLIAVGVMLGAIAAYRRHRS